MRVLIVGASGFIGGRLVRRFAAAGHQVVAAARDPSSLDRFIPGLTLLPVDLRRDGEAEWRTRLAGIDLVINAAGVIDNRSANPMDAVHASGPASLFAACLQVGVPRVIQISALGADPEGTTCYFRSKGSADAVLSGLDPTRERLEWIIVRPSVVVGRGGGSHELFTGLAAWPLIPRLGPGCWQMQPVHVLDLVELIHDLATTRERTLPRIDAIGPEPVTTDALTSLLRQWLGLTGGRFIPVPVGMLRLAGWLGDHLPLGPLNREALAMLMQGNTIAREKASLPEGWMPRTIPVALLAEPATSGDLWQARLSPMKHLLRGILGCFWIASGLIPMVMEASRQEGYALLARTGLTDGWTTVALYGAGLLDLLLGVMLLTGKRSRLIGGLGIGATLMFTGIILVFMPEFAWHPFGPLTKNLPLVAAMLILMILEEK